MLVVPQRRQALERLVLHATSLRIPVVEVEGGSLTAVAGFDGHQGIALVVEPRVFAGLDDLLARAVERGEPPFILVMDSLEDPQNVGTLLRSAEAAGVHGVLFPTRRQAPLSPAAIKASAGAVEHLLLCPVDDLAGALSDLRIRGLRVAAAEADAPMTTAQADLRGPLAIVVGSEGQGLSPLIRRRADVAVRIPMRGAIGSLNAAVAGSILLFAAVAQRDPGGEGSDSGGRAPRFDELADGHVAELAEQVDTANAAAVPEGPQPKAGRKQRKGLSTEPPAESASHVGAGLETAAAADAAETPRAPAKATKAVRATMAAETSTAPAKATTASAPPAAKTAPAKAAKALPSANDPQTAKVAKPATGVTGTAPPATTGTAAPSDAAAPPAPRSRRRSAADQAAAAVTAEPATLVRRRKKALNAGADGSGGAASIDPTDEELLPGGPPPD
ncbi:MAG TPA: 23S rRNA (guanosine(2251)-2'-O)-methyltransferase RlmB [Patescibacteria group bacterium]|nr:23S rRNA (guanosine(2251)-2'-O)-methyltransferase RlmB [Patescibacteria group bacterium]